MIEKVAVFSLAVFTGISSGFVADDLVYQFVSTKAFEQCKHSGNFREFKNPFIQFFYCEQ